MPDASPIVIAYDGSDAARAAVNEAAVLFGSRPAIVVTVWEPGLADYMLMPNTMGTGTMMMPYDPATVQAIDKAAEDHARDIAEDGAQLAQAGGLRAEALPVRDAARHRRRDPRDRLRARRGGDRDRLARPERLQVETDGQLLRGRARPLRPTRRRSSTRPASSRTSRILRYLIAPPVG